MWKFLYVYTAVDATLTDEFDQWLARNNKKYSSPEEYKIRKAIFESNKIKVEKQNSGNGANDLGHVTFALNKFADLTADEFKSKHTGCFKNSYKAPRWGASKNLGGFKYSGAPLAESVDWVEKGAVTPVKNQGQCGSCWSFSTTGALEGAWHRHSGKLVSLSEQQLVDCSKDYGNMGCNGGLMDHAFEYAESHGICTEESYPYEADDEKQCHNKSCDVAIPKDMVKGYHDVIEHTDEALMEALNIGPVSIAIEADKEAFQLYHGGILKRGCGHNLDHGVLVVGYGEDAGVPYWKVKNSWGPEWGDHGYIRLLRGKPGEAGECGILLSASFPVFKKETPAPSPLASHYGPPPCQGGDAEVRIEGVTGVLCCPKCAGSTCPAGPAGSHAMCVLQDPQQNKYCGLVCTSNDQCPAKSTCSVVAAGVGLCSWPADASANVTLARAMFGDRSQHIIV